MKEKQGLTRDIMVIGSTGFRTFVDPQGELHQVIQNCREARIMLLNPDSEGAISRAKSILDPEITPATMGTQIRRSIDFLKELKAVQKSVRLKLYDETPLLKLTILGDYIWLQHYHPGVDVKLMPEFVFKHDQNTGSLYLPLYQYFLVRWNNPDIPEYDLDTDELVYRDPSGNELRRRKSDEVRMEVATHVDSSHHLNPENRLERNIYPLMRNHRERASIEDLVKNVW